MLAELDTEEDDLQFAMTAYGLCVLLETHGEIEKADALREKLLARDGFWFCFSYLAAYSDYNYTVKPATVKWLLPVVALSGYLLSLCVFAFLVPVMMVNNETGAVMPIRDMIRATRCKSPLALFHTDAVQGFFKLPFRAKTLGADLISVSGHKIHAAKVTDDQIVCGRQRIFFPNCAARKTRNAYGIPALFKLLFGPKSLAGGSRRSNQQLHRKWNLTQSRI